MFYYNSLYFQVHGKADPQTCDQCGMICRNKRHLNEHIQNKHKRNKTPIPCAQCGKLINTDKMNCHIMTVHTPDHLKPFVCKVCNKGFITKSKLEDHTNIHLGLKPHVCKYCGTGFADVANKRMHERCAHEGHKRFEKNNK